MPSAAGIGASELYGLLLDRNIVGVRSFDLIGEELALALAIIEIPAEELAIPFAGQMDIAMHFGPVADCVVQRNLVPLWRQRRIPAKAVRSIVFLFSFFREVGRVNSLSSRWALG